MEATIEKCKLPAKRVWGNLASRVAQQELLSISISSRLNCRVVQVQLSQHFVLPDLPHQQQSWASLLCEGKPNLPSSLQVHS